MAAAFEIATLRFIFENLNLLVAADEGNRSRDFCAGNHRSADGGGRTIVYHEHFIKGDLVTLLYHCWELFNRNDRPCGDDKLLPSRLDYCDFHSWLRIAFEPLKY